MRVKQQSEHGEHSTNSSQLLINQLREITSIQDPQILLRALNASQGDISHAVGLLTTQPAENGQGTPETPDKEGNIEAWEAQTDASPKDDLQTAIELSLQESQAEERELNRALEASVEDSAARVKRKRCEPQGESSSPADWIRQEDWPVGIRNVGNTCWFSAVIQSLFHLPVFRRLVLNYCLSERILEKCKSPSDKRNIAFMQELRCLFALMTGSTRRFVDPSAAVELLRDAFRTSEAQQDVSEFTHKLLDWLEDAFQLAANGNSPEDKKENPMVQLFYGTFVAERIHEGKILSNIEQFGQYPLQVNGFNNLDECLEGAMVEGEIEALYSDQTISSGSERWFSTLPPVLTFELSRFEFNQSLGRPEKIHKKLEFPQIIYMDRLLYVNRYLHKNNEQTHSRRGEAKKLKEQLTVLQQKLECYRHYGSGPVKYPLADMLQYVLEFACTKPSSVSPAEDVRPASSSPTPSSSNLQHADANDTSQCQEPGEAGPSDGPACQQQPPLGQRTPIYKPFTQCRPIMDSPPHPAPHCVAEEELRFVKTCLQRWRTEVENNINELKASIDRVSQELEGMYSDNSLCQVPYRLHAVLVHEGQASAGHYWAYIYDHHNQHWMKYNDVIVTESSWEELVRDSYGGITNASAYCLMYINDNLPHLIAEDTDNETGQATKGMDSLPAVLRRYVREDNRWFQQELKDWEEQFCQPPRDEPAAPTAASPSPCGPSQDQPAEPGHALEPTGEQEQEPEAEPAAVPTVELGEPVPRSQPPSPVPDSPESPGSSTEDDQQAGSVTPEEGERQEHSQQLPPPRSLSPAAETSGQAQAAAVIPDPSTGVSPEADGRPEVTEARGEAAEAPDSQVDGTDGQDASAASTRRHQQSEDMVSEVEIPNVGKILVRADTDGYNEEMMLTPAMQGIIMAIAKARQVFDSDGPEAGLIKAFHEEYSRLFELSQEETTPQRDPRLHHALVYFFQNQAPNRVIERTLLEGFTDRNLSFDDRSISIMREARAKLRLIKPEDMDMEEYMQWHDDYSLFRTVFVYLLTGLEQYQHGKVREALNYLNHAYKDNAMLLRRGDRRGVDQSLIALHRRRCLKEVNDNAAMLFRSSEVSDVEDGVVIMNEAVIPCMQLMSRPDTVSQEDLDTMEAIRSHWCSYLGVDLEDSLQEKLGEFLPRVLDCSTEMVVLKDPPTVRSKVPHDLCSRLAAIMESITNTSAVAVK
ncbi:ubiquitin carboxyl-terminal hydrolase 28 isoform X1 [Esox lucius]|uniref:ubiquitin carboxyl-terminal hydrolase 28 isoform X1 n=1 Tax=Esox lucius TaxID=8010 RepID=UPI0014773D21|nr:ubiquitin carboxyl-terminal hydrolase 28 isoform X1 [Esox lucius]